jgi:hypothetical protein
MKKVCRSIACSAALLTLLVPPSASAQDMAAAQAKLQARMEEAQKVASIEADKEGFVGELLARFASTAAEKGYDAFVSKGTKKLLRKSARDLQRLSENAKDFDTFYKLVFEGYTIDSFGQLTQDLVFFPISACRIYDSRNATAAGLGGPMAPGTQRAISVNDGTSVQGGANPECVTLIPDIVDDPPALAITLTAASPTGPGNLRTFASGAPVPNAAMLTYTAGTTISTGTVTSSAGGRLLRADRPQPGSGQYRRRHRHRQVLPRAGRPAHRVPDRLQPEHDPGELLWRLRQPGVPGGHGHDRGRHRHELQFRGDLDVSLFAERGEHRLEVRGTQPARVRLDPLRLLRRLLQHSGPLTYRQARVRSV